MIVIEVKKMITKYKKMSIQAKTAIWFTICSLVQKGISFITIPIFTRIMSTNDYGTYNLYLSWFQIFTIITSLYLYYGVLNSAMIKYDKERDAFISSMQFLTTIISVIVLILYILFHNSLNSIIGLSTPLMILMFIQLTIDPSKNFWFGKQRFDYKYKKLILVTLVQSLLNPFLGVLFVFLFENDTFGRILSIVIVESLFCVPIMIYQYKKGRVLFSKKYWKFGAKMAIPLIPHYLSGMVLNQGDRIVISKIIDNSAVAIYSIAYSVGMIGQIFTSALINSYIPTFLKNLKAGHYQNSKYIINTLLSIVAFISIVMSLFAPELVSIFGNSEYSNAVYVIPPISASLFFIFMYNVFAIPQFYYERTSFLMISSVISAISNIVLNIIFVPVFGMIAAAYTTLFCYIIYSVGHFIISNLMLKKNNIDNFFDKKIIIALSILVVLLNLLIVTIYKQMILRYTIILSIIIICYFYKRRLSLLIRNLNQSSN